VSGPKAVTRVVLRSGPDDASKRKKSLNGKYLMGVYSVEILLMMDSGHVRNM